MGIETIIAIAAIAASTAATGYEVSASRDQAREGKDAQRKQEQAVRNQNAALAEKQAQADATTAARTARMRQRALLAENQGNDSMIATSPLGLAPQAGTGAAPGTPAGGLTKLGQ